MAYMIPSSTAAMSRGSSVTKNVSPSMVTRTISLSVNSRKGTGPLDSDFFLRCGFTFSASTVSPLWRYAVW